MNQKYEKFMIDSNAIEGETGLNPGDIKAIKSVVGHGIKNEDRLLQIHKILTKHLKVRWSGKYRDCNVVVGNYHPPAAASVPYKMKEFFERLPRLTSWEAHNVFEGIHPFRDFNGRTGRLIWLSKALKEYHNPFCLPFLQLYYYQTLSYWAGRPHAVTTPEQTQCQEE